MRGERGGRGDRYHLKLSEHNSYMFLFVWWFSNCSLSFLFLFLQPLGMGPTTMHIHIKGLPPNTVHGFHIHEYGDTFSDGTFAWSNTNKIVTNVLIACGTSLVFPRFSDEHWGKRRANTRQTRGEREVSVKGESCTKGEGEALLNVWVLLTLTERLPSLVRQDKIKKKTNKHLSQSLSWRH